MKIGSLPLISNSDTSDEFLLRRGNSLYRITKDYLVNEFIDNTLSPAISDISSDLQPLDSDLTSIAAITPSNDDIIQRKNGSWTNRTMAQVKTDLVMTATDILNVATSGSGGNISATTVQAALNELDSEKALLSHTHTVSQITDIPATLPGIAGDPIWAAAGDLVIGTADNTAQVLAKGTAGQVLTMNSEATAPAWNDTINANLLINGGFDFFQKTVPTTATAMTHGVLNAPDRWFSLVYGANATINREAGIGTSQYAAKIVVGADKKIHGIGQIVESNNSIPMRGKTVTAQCRIKPVLQAGGVATEKYRIAILEWTGTADTISTKVTKIIAAADWTKTTYAVGQFFEGTTKTLVGISASVAATHNVETVLSVAGTVSASCNNLIVVIFVEGGASALMNNAADYTLIGEAGLYQSSVVQAWHPRPIGEELALCQRYYYKNDILVAYITLGWNQTIGDGVTSVGLFTLPTPMRTNAITFNKSAASHFYIAGGSNAFSVLNITFSYYSDCITGKLVGTHSAFTANTLSDWANGNLNTAWIDFTNEL